MFGNDMFSMTKAYYMTALDNFALYQKNSEQMLRIFIGQLGCLDESFIKNYDEWVANSDKAFDDYRKLIIDGLAYLGDTFEKKHNGGRPAGVSAPVAPASGIDNP